jgi:hypothetical protein
MGLVAAEIRAGRRAFGQRRFGQENSTGNKSSVDRSSVIKNAIFNLLRCNEIAVISIFRFQRLCARGESNPPGRWPARSAPISKDHVIEQGHRLGRVRDRHDDSIDRLEFDDP